MTGTASAAPLLQLVAEDAQGTVVLREVLAHGADPVRALAAAGWQVERATGVDSDLLGGHVLTLRFLVHRCDATAPADESVSRAAGLRIEPGEAPRIRQRVAAYAVVHGPDGLLLTELSDQTGAPGSWGLPGGGIERDESPQDAALREVWEETGQRVELGELLQIQTSHWIGRAPSGLLEDFHAVRIIYAATCTEPVEPVVHDVGGTTAAAAWVEGAALELVGLTPGWRAVLAGLGLVSPAEHLSARDG